MNPYEFKGILEGIGIALIIVILLAWLFAHRISNNI